MLISKQFELSSVLKKFTLVACFALSAPAYGQPCNDLRQSLMVGHAAFDVLSTASPLVASGEDDALGNVRTILNRAMTRAQGSVSSLIKQANRQHSETFGLLANIEKSVQSLSSRYALQMSRSATSSQRVNLRRNANIASAAHASARLARYQSVLALQCR